MSRRQRLDIALVGAGLFDSRARARDAVLRGAVRLDGSVVTKPGLLVEAGATRLSVDDPARTYVSRAALKLAHGLDVFGYSPEGRVALDLGASTGGFTQVLLERGAARVYAVDVGHGQLHASLAADARVVSMQGLNARALGHRHVPEAPDAMVADLSFVSLRLALPPALALAAPGAWGVFLVKPQFEVGREGVGKGGIVRDAARAEKAARDVADWLDGEMGWRVAGLAVSPITGGDGNREYVLGAANG